MREKNKLVRCPYCKGTEFEYNYWNDPPPYDHCCYCNGDGVVTLAKKMEYIRSFKKMDEIEKDAFFDQERRDYDPYEYEDLDYLISMYNYKKEGSLKE